MSTRSGELFREAMALFPSGVTIVTTTDGDGRWWGFTATSFCSVSMDPPLILVCLATSAECYATFEVARHWVVQVLHLSHADLAIRFATRGADKFATGEFVADGDGLPILERACVTLHCSSHAAYPGGDHIILVGRIEEARVAEVGQIPAVYFRRSFHSLPSSAVTP